MAGALAQPTAQLLFHRFESGALAPHHSVTAEVLAELAQLRRLIDRSGRSIERRVVGRTDDGLDLEVITLGTPDLQRPALGFFGGVHGLERIGVQVVASYLRTLIERLRWDSTLDRQLELMRLVFMPLVNPGGLLRGTRANPNGVDLMRNAPLDAVDPVPWLVGGHRIGASLPWYRGRAEDGMQAESRALCDVVASELQPRPFSVALDCHSGFGSVDRIWFPHAHTTRPIEHLPEVHALTEIFEQSHAHHRYVIEPQSRQYLAHGDLWDWLYVQATSRHPNVFLPLTLEMGSWSWVRKNPRQLLRRGGIFNPLIEHRLQRVLRHHVTWLDFLTRAVVSHQRWRPEGAGREHRRTQALRRWYGPRP